MKTFYLIKPFAPFLFLPVAPGLLEAELERHGTLGLIGSFLVPVLVQLVLTVILLLILNRTQLGKAKSKTILRMSCVSKKVFYKDKWHSIEEYLLLTQGVLISHGMTPEESATWVREALEKDGAAAAVTKAAAKPRREPALFTAMNDLRRKCTSEKEEWAL